MSNSILYQFKKTLDSLSKAKVLNLDYSLLNKKLLTKKEFVVVVNSLLEKLHEIANFNLQISESEVSNLTNALKSFIENIVLPEHQGEFGFPLLSFELINKVDFLKQVENERTDIAKLNLLKEYILDNILNKNNTHLKDLIVDNLWEEYFKIQKENNITAPNFTSQIEESTNGYLNQIQTEPIKRAFFIAFTSLFDYLNETTYLTSKGESKVDYSLDKKNNVQSKDNNADFWKQKYGVPFPL